MSERDGAAFRQRQGWSFRERLRAPDSYGLLLPLIILSLFATAVSRPNAGDVIAVSVGGGTLLFALYTSRAPRSMRYAAGVLLVGSALAAAIVGGSDPEAELALGSAVLLVLYAGALAAIVRRLGGHLRVDGATLLGVMCVYLLLGLVFASLFGLIGAIQHTAFFTGNAGDGTWTDRVYFSYTTLTTVGYGDFAAATGVGRIAAISEALTGQLYLVSVVALVVGNFGRSRPAPEARRGGDRGPGLRPTD